MNKNGNMNSLEWNVLLPKNEDFKFNIFNSVRFREYLMDLKARCQKEHNVGLKEAIRSGLMYCFWCSAEYEILISGLFDKEPLKIDVYTQVEQNLDRFYEYLMTNWDKIPALSYKQRTRVK